MTWEGGRSSQGSVTVWTLSFEGSGVGERDLHGWEKGNEC